LTEQNELFAAALSARKRGDTSAALGLFEKLIVRYPRSTLAENAMVERMRLLAGNREQQRREAARYSRSYPQGFAHEEAERIGASE
jgi:TolA-binding protein